MMLLRGYAAVVFSWLVQALAGRMITLELGQHRVRQDRRRLGLATELTPMLPGYGTHFSYIYVGTPPQRQSVIVDTGSHYTAFPCSGCSQCGQHTDPYWDLKNSSTATVPKCQNQPCVISQSYSEGSSWRAIKVVDKLWVGGLDKNSIPDASLYSVNFLFGCQTSETGLFRTQLADGIMGMGISDDTLPSQLLKQGVTNSKVFALCFRIGGGIMTLGGVDPRIHSKPQINYAKLAKTGGWYNINVLDIFLVHRDTKERKSLGADKSIYQQGKGSIVDSGTTDTYLPSAVASKFQALFKELSGVGFTQANTQLDQAQLDKMPNIVYVIEDTDGKTFEVLMPWTNYVDSVGGGKYAFRIYLTEGSGSVLGANFMAGYNVVFDYDGQRVGFAKSDCKYEDFVVSPPALPSPNPTLPPAWTPQTSNGSSSSCIPAVLPLSQCSARCSDPTKPAYLADGTQVVTDSCQSIANPATRSAPCHEPCNLNKIVRGDITCPNKPWGECSKSCIQSRMMPYTEDLQKGLCRYTQQTRTCNTGDCPTEDGDYLAFVDLRVMIFPSEWSYVHTEAFYCAMASVLGVKDNAVELLNSVGIGNEYTSGVKLHFEIRIRAKDFSDVIQFRHFAQSVPDAVWRMSFPESLVGALDTCSKRTDGLDFSRYGYMLPRDVEILNAIALPMGSVRDPVEIPDDSVHGDDIVGAGIGLGGRKLDFFFAGTFLALVLCSCLVCCIQRRLQQERSEWMKDKETSLSRRFKAWAQKYAAKMGGNKGAAQGGGAGAAAGEYAAVQMTELGGDDELAEGAGADFDSIGDADLDGVDDLDGLRA